MQKRKGSVFAYTHTHTHTLAYMTTLPPVLSLPNTITYSCERTLEQESPSPPSHYNVCFSEEGELVVYSPVCARLHMCSI